MDYPELVKSEFESLRGEIEQSKDRVFKTLILGVTLVPAGQYLGKIQGIDVILLAMPLLIFAFGLIFLAESHGIMRCGRYIRLHIEPKAKDCLGWEQWLASPDDFGKRSVDNYLAFSFHLIFFVYFSGSVYLAGRFAAASYGLVASAVVIGGYAGIGICFAVVLILRHRTSTTIAGEQVAPLPRPVPS